ncbi:Glt [Aphelenchoides bicaudatus]|nr:Glt [Aphelenchoides bicaudatus]
MPHVVLLGLGLVFFLGCIVFSIIVPADLSKLITINGQNNSHHIIGRQLILSKGNYFTGIEYGVAANFQSGKLVQLAREVNAVRWGDECSTNFYINGSSSKCLNLNVYQCTPIQDQFLPVLVYFHEGETNWDSTANLDAKQVIDNLACKGMVVVSVNYRASIFGGFSFQHPNPAITDVQLALEWVNKNIKHFNGDSNQITAMGSRKGAQIISYLSQMPKTRMLFSQVILIGGTADDPDIFDNNRYFTFQQIQKMALRFQCIDENKDPETMSRSEQDGVIECMNGVRKQAILRLDKRLRQFWNRWPIDTRTCQNPVGKSTEKSINKQRLTKVLQLNRDLKRTHNPEAFTEHYLNLFSEDSMGTMRALKQIRTNFMEVAPLLLEAHRLSSQPDSNVFLFNMETRNTRYDYNPELDKQKTNFDQWKKKASANDDMSAQKFMSESIANFVINGNPNKINSSDLKWPKFSPIATTGTYNSLKVNAKGIEVVENWERSTAQFWLCEQERARKCQHKCPLFLNYLKFTLIELD